MRSLARIAVAAVACGLSACSSPAGAQTVTDRQDFPTIERGRYLTVAGDCAACHTLPGSGQQLAGGRAIETPFGTLLAANITPDRTTGIGAWSDEEVVNALLNGTGRGGRHLYPAMPYTYFTRMTREDALAILAYLKTVPPVHNRVVANQLPFPFNVRVSLIGWNALFFKPGRLRPRADKTAEWNRGAYLVEGAGHCGMCHTPKNLLGGDDSDQALRGYSLQGWFAPDVTNNPYRGLGDWSDEDIVSYLKTGHNRMAAASGPMAEEVALSSSQMTDADLHAMAVYLKDQTAGEAKPVPLAATDPVMQTGAAIYADECSACHTPNGGGVTGLFPALSGAPAVQSREPTSLLHVVLQGTRSVGTAGAPTAAGMPSFGWLLSDDEVAAVTTYVRNAWGNAATAVSASDVASARRSLARHNN